MDTTGPLEAEAEIEQHFRSRPRGSEAANHRARDAMQIGAGAVNTSEPTESSPLLGDDQAASQVEDTGGWTGYKEYEGLPWYKRPSVFWMIPPFLLFALAFGGVIVAKVNLINDLICRDYLREQALAHPGWGIKVPSGPGWGEGNPECDSPGVVRRAAIFVGADAVLGGALTALSSPWIGAMADRYGRTRIIGIASAGGLVKEALSITAANYFDTFPVWLLFVGFIADGLCGGFVAGMAVAHAYASDTTAPSRRSVAFGYFHICLFTGIAAGPVIGGLVSKKTGTFLTMFYVAFACHIFFILFTMLIIPESVPKWRQKIAREQHAYEMSLNTDPWYYMFKPKKFFAPLKILWPKGEGSSPGLRRNLVLLCAIDTVMFGLAMGVLAVFVLYVKTQFHWSQLEQSEFVSLVSTVRVVALFLILPTINRLVRGPARISQAKRQAGCDRLDLALIRSGVFIDLIGFMGYTLTRDGNWFMVYGCIAALGAIAPPTMQSAQTKHVPAHKVGQLLGATGMLHSIARVIIPLVFSAVFRATVGYYNQAIFLILTIGFVISFGLTWLLKPGIYLEDENAPASGVTEDASVNGEVGRS